MTEMRIWLDDIREPPSGWCWAKTVGAARMMLNVYGPMVSEISLDNDLGEGEPEGRKLVLWMCEDPRRFPPTVKVHSANVVAHEAMTGMIERYKP